MPYFINLPCKGLKTSMDAIDGLFEASKYRLFVVAV